MVTNTTVTKAEASLVENGEQRDRIGRRITPAARRTELVEAWRQSGQTQAAFARREGVRYSTFASWVQQGRTASGRPAAAAPKLRFAEVQMLGASSAVAVEVTLADGTVVRGADARAVAAVTRALRG
jgi:transposase-like protein